MMFTIIPRIFTGIFVQFFYKPVRNVFFVCCVLLVARMAMPSWLRWISHAQRHLRGTSPNQRTTPPDCGVRNILDGQERSSGGGANTEKRKRIVIPDGSKPPPARCTLQILHDDIKAAVDIVAVHGLGANPDYAWVWLPKNNPPGHPGYPDKPLNWLEKLLPAKLSCRVMVFNYNSKWFMNAPQQRLSNISDTLLDSLRNKREEARNRPLIFIGHSFGGNIIEQAIVDASRYNSEFGCIAESTAGVVFLGTPHRGTRAASWGAFLASLIPPGFIVESRILEDLKEHSGPLTDCLNHFSKWLLEESVPVLCCFENLVTDYTARTGYFRALVSFFVKPELVVPEASACIDGHPRISLDADHLKINKFYGSEDPSFQRIYPRIIRMAENAETILERRRNPKAIPPDDRLTSGVLQACLREMRVTNPRDILSEVQNQKEKRVKNTCEWILGHEKLTAWSADEHSRLLRLIGSPGIGKTMISTLLVDVLERKVTKIPDKTFSYFFCDDKDKSRNTPTAILRSLIWQLLVQKNELFRHIRPDFEKHTREHVFERLFENFSALWRIFREMLHDQQAGEVIILIDALDECDRSTRQDLLVGIRELFQLSSQTGRFKVLITCRPKIRDIEYQLEQVGVSFRLDSGEINADLNNYIDSNVKELATRHRYSSQLEKDVRTALRAQAGGTFLWVSLMLKKLREIPRDEVRNNLKGLPEGLDETYAQILDQNDSPAKQERARFLLWSMVAARRPLRKIEVAAAFAVWKAGLVLRDQDLHNYMDICSSCGSLVDFAVANNDPDSDYDSNNDRNATINFCHQSVKDFLLKEHGGSKGAWYSISQDSANLHMFQVCWDYLSSGTFDHGNEVVYLGSYHGLKSLHTICNSRRHRFPEYSFFTYASREWKDHAIASYPALLDGLNVNLTEAPTMRDAWLLEVVKNRHEAVIKLLLDRGAQVDSTDEESQTPLVLAAQAGQEALVKLLLDKGADVNLQDRRYRTPLMWAVGNGHEAIVQLLLDRGARVDLHDKNFQTPLVWAAQNGHEAIAKLLLDKGAKVDWEDGGRNTPLAWAARFGHEAVVKLLLDRGAKVNVKNPGADEPLYGAAEHGHEAVVKLLLDRGAEVDLKNCYEQTPLMIATMKGHEAVVKLLLERGAEADVKDNMDRTPLFFAVQCGFEASVELLLDRGADVDSKQYGGWTPLSLAAERGHEAIKKLLQSASKAV